MNLLRQYTAIAILLFSLQYVIDRSFGKFIIIVLLATTVHQTAICFSLIYFVYPIKISKKYLLMTVIGSVAIYIFLAISYLVVPLHCLTYPSLKSIL